MFGRKGTGGRVMFGYRQVAAVQAWSYKPEPTHGQGPEGAGVVEVILADVDPMYANVSGVSLELRGQRELLRWPEVEMLSDATLIVPGPPTTSPL